MKNRILILGGARGAANLGLLVMIMLFAVVYGKAQTNVRSIEMNGVDGYVVVPHSKILNPTNQMTVSAWIRAESWGTNVYDNYIVGKDDWAGEPSGYSLRAGADGLLSFNISLDGKWQEVVSNTTMASKKWYHVAGVYDGYQIKVYINGEMVGAKGATGTVTASIYNLNIGRTPYTASPSPRFFHGKVDQVEIWMMSLEKSRIKEFMNCPPIGSEDGLVGYWDMEEASGLALVDKSYYGNYGRLMDGIVRSDDVPVYACCRNFVVKSPSDMSIPVASTGKFIVHSSATPAAFQWQTDLGFGFVNITDAGQFNGVVTDTLIISNATINNNNQLFRCIIVAGECIDTSKSARLKIVTDVSVPNQSQSGSVVTWPSPCLGALNIDCANCQDGTPYIIRDIMGRAVYEGRWKLERVLLDVSTFSPGVYVLEMGSDSSIIVVVTQ